MGADLRSRRALCAVVVVCALIVGACSSDGSDDAADTGGDAGVEIESSGDQSSATTTPTESESSGDQSSATTTPTESESDDIDTANVDCAALEDAVLGVRDTGAQLTVAKEQEDVERVFEFSTVEDLQEDVAVLRPYQDIEGESFGSMRAGLDNLEADLAAYSEGRWDERVGDYPLLQAVEVFNVLGCG